jgi:hypothetical protein
LAVTVNVALLTVSLVLVSVPAVRLASPE